MPSQQPMKNEPWSLSALSSCLWSHQGVRRHSRPKKATAGRKARDRTQRREHHPHRGPAGSDNRLHSSRWPGLHTSLWDPLTPIAGPVGNDTGSAVRKQATLRLRVFRAAHPQHLSTDYNPNDNVRQGYSRPPLLEAPRLSNDAFIGKRPANSEPVGQPPQHHSSSADASGVPCIATS